MHDFENMTIEQLVEFARGDLSGLTGAELASLRSALATVYSEARPNVETDEQVAALGDVASAVTLVQDETGKREAEDVARAERLAALDSTVNGDDGDGAESDTTDSETAEDTETETEGAAGGTETESSDGDNAGDASASESDTGTETEGAAGGTETEGAEERELVTASAPDLSVLVRTRNASETGGGASTEGLPPLELRSRVVAQAVLPGVARGDVFASVGQLGEGIANAARDLRVHGEPSDRKYHVAKVFAADRPHVVRQDDFKAVDGFSIIDEAVRRNAARKADDDRVVASGGVCAPGQQDYTITVVGGEPGPLWVDRLPTVTGNRPISSYPWINFSLTDAAGSRVGARPDGGTGFVTAAQDAAGYGDPALGDPGDPGAVPVGGAPFKPEDCLRLDCPDPISEMPEAVYHCLCVGNFQALTWPEYVKIWQETIGKYHEFERDERALAKFVAAAKKIPVNGPTFGAARDLLDTLRRFVAHQRSVRGDQSLSYNFDIPAFARGMIASDLAFSWGGGSDALRVSSAQALAILSAEEGITLGEYRVSIGATGGGSPTILSELADGVALPEWPEEIRILAYPEGGIWRHEYGEISIGLKETSSKTNDVCGFQENFESMNFRTSDLFALDVPLCVNGAAGAAVAKVCGGE